MRNILVGADIKLTAVKDTDLSVIEDWFNDTEFLRYYDMVPALPRSRAQVEAYIKDYETSEERYIFAVRANDTGKIIGVAGFEDIIWSNGVATVFIGIGDRSYTGKGLGREAMKMVLDFGFNELNFYRIQLNVISYNKAALGLYESLGFVREGTYRNFILRDGKRYDMCLYGMLRPEWDKKFGQTDA